MRPGPMERNMHGMAPVEEGGRQFVPCPPYQDLPGEAALWQRWVDEQDYGARDILARHYQGYARALAAQLYGRRVSDEFEFDEYLQFATVGMIESLDRFDPALGAMFKTFATRRITGAILSGLTSLSERQEQIVLRRRVAEERTASLKDDRPAEEDPEALLRELANIGVGLALGYILDGTGMMEGGEQALPDNTYTRIELKQFQERIKHLVRNLTEREQDVVRLHYFQSKSFDEVAEQLGLTKGRISQLHKQALLRLRTLIAASAGIDVVL
jgi:RNA polymerase sigma factor FliA